MCFLERTRVLDELPSGPGYRAAGPGFMLTSSWQTKSGVVRHTHAHTHTHEMGCVLTS